MQTASPPRRESGLWRRMAADPRCWFGLCLAGVPVLVAVFGPLAVPHALRPSLGITLTDSIDALARAAIAHYLADQPEQRIAA